MRKEGCSMHAVRFQLGLCHAAVGAAIHLRATPALKAFLFIRTAGIAVLETPTKLLRSRRVPLLRHKKKAAFRRFFHVKHEAVATGTGHAAVSYTRGDLFPNK
jgi:hypothetical protein